MFEIKVKAETGWHTVRTNRGLDIKSCLYNPIEKVIVLFGVEKEREPGSEAIYWKEIAETDFMQTYLFEVYITQEKARFIPGEYVGTVNLYPCGWDVRHVFIR